ncbi:MAG: 3-dehydroquinate synthase [Flavobacteriales bacterium]|nr:3-dehydroquinate synthase [Flavobacteriales bacterium]
MFKPETVYFENEGIKKLNEYVQEINPSKIIILVDENTHKYCYPKFITDLETDSTIEIIEVESGEIHKNIQTCYQLWLSLSDVGADRKTLMINLGGGVVTDMGSFVASTYMRGIKFINIPTTLLSMSDASVGGKTGVDLDSLKNLVGTFSLAEMVLVHSQFLETLDEVQLKSGFAEVIKHALIADKNQWEELKSIDYKNINQLKDFLPKTVSIKADIVTQDYKEQNIRKNLNFGHTIGHALESMYLQSGTTVFHGEAVAMGMLAESYISKELELLSEEEFKEIEKYILNIYTVYPFSEDDFEFIFSAMRKDKKNENNDFRFSLLEKIGKGVYNQKVSEKLILASFYYLIDLGK